jgi:hypothetical protein
MATRYSKATSTTGVIPSGYESTSPNSSDAIASCGVEDVDRALFTLFSEKLPLFYKISKDTGEQRRVPVMFASGERFAVLSKTSPLRDKNGALILPMISITRNGLEFDTTKQGGTSDKLPETIIRKKLSPEDASYQNLINSAGLKNSGHMGRNSKSDWLRSSGRILGPELGRNLYEFTVIPTPKYFTAKYEISIWCQYVQQLNTIIETIAGSYPQPGNRTIRIDTPKGYWFVAYFESSINQDNNFSDYSDSERIIKATLAVEVPAYLILPKAPGIPNGTKKYLSAPEISFEVNITPKIDGEYSSSILPSGDIGRYVLEDIETVDDPVPHDFIGSKTIEIVNEESKKNMSGDIPPRSTTSVGSYVNKKNNKRKIEFEFDPLTGKEEKIIVQVMDSNPSRGEEVYIINPLDRRK